MCPSELWTRSLIHLLMNLTSPKITNGINFPSFILLRSFLLSWLMLPTISVHHLRLPSQGHWPRWYPRLASTDRNQNLLWGVVGDPIHPTRFRALVFIVLALALDPFVVFARGLLIVYRSHQPLCAQYHRLFIYTCSSSNPVFQPTWPRSIQPDYFNFKHVESNCFISDPIQYWVNTTF